MANIFPLLDLEAIVQEGDKTRLDGSGSFIGGPEAIEEILISPSKGVTALDVTTLTYLDWAYTFTIDVDSANNKISFSEGASPSVEATIPDGAYSLASLASVIETALDAAGSLTYTVTVNADNSLTIAAASTFALYPLEAASLLPEIGFAENVSDAITYESEEISTVNKLVTISVTADGDTVVKTGVIQVISELSDRLFSDDAHLRQHEPEIKKYLVQGRASFKDVHRRAQELILAWLHKEGFINDQGDPVVVSQIQHREDVTEWSTHMALRLIFEGVSNAVDDVFAKKASTYGKGETFYRDRAYVRINGVNSSGSDSSLDFERVDIRSCRVVRR